MQLVADFQEARDVLDGTRERQGSEEAALNVAHKNHSGETRRAGNILPGQQVHSSVHRARNPQPHLLSYLRTISGTNFRCLGLQERKGVMKINQKISAIFFENSASTLFVPVPGLSSGNASSGCEWLSD